MEQVAKYFNAEKQESVMFIFVGLVAIAFAIYFFVKVRQPFFNGMAYPLIAVALIQIVAGSSVYLRSPKDIVRVNQILQTDKQKIKTEEIPRMVTVMKNFVLYKWLEIVLVLIGAIMFFYFRSKTFWSGAGGGLFIQAGFMLVLDFFAESRGKTYLEYLRTLA